jgi:hypothetical protein
LKIIIESTQEMTWVENRDGDCRCAVPGRIWEGKTDTGIYVQCVITRIAAPNEADLSQFQRELTEQIAPQRTNVFPLRMVI